MITPEAVRQQLKRRYPDFQRAWLRGEPFTPISLPAGKMPDTYTEFREAVLVLKQGEKTGKKPGYRIESTTRALRKFGQQQVPERIIIESAADYLALTETETAFARFTADVAAIRQRLPTLESWLHENPAQVEKYHGEWPSLLEVTAYCAEHSISNQYMREIPVSVHSKFIEAHTGILTSLLDAVMRDEDIRPDEKRFTRRYGLREPDPLVRMRVLDRQIERRWGLALTDVSVPLMELAALDLRGEYGLIVENLTTFLALPDFARTFALFGKGFEASRLGTVSWLHECPLFYWGDLDAQGFQILAQLRRSLPHVRSLMMDEATFEQFRAYAVTGTPAPVTLWPELTPEEMRLCRYLAETSLRLEQERIPHAHAAGVIAAAIAACAHA
jgi:hypothetical protein